METVRATSGDIDTFLCVSFDRIIYDVRFIVFTPPEIVGVFVLRVKHRRLLFQVSFLTHTNSSKLFVLLLRRDLSCLLLSLSFTENYAKALKAFPTFSEEKKVSLSR